MCFEVCFSGLEHGNYGMLHNVDAVNDTAEPQPIS